MTDKNMYITYIVHKKHPFQSKLELILKDDFVTI